jgi:uncharacterized protein (DUF58 family)
LKIDLAEIRKFGNIEMLAKQLVEGFITGLHKSPYHGFSVEFAEHRLYNSGESTRHIDWKVFGKTDKLFTKRYEEETNLRCQILIDTSSSMFYPSENKGKITFSIFASACLAYLLQTQRDAIGITTFGEDIELQTPIKSTPGHIHSLFIVLQNLLAQTPIEKKTSVASVIHKIADKMNKRSLIVIFSDMFESDDNNVALFQALQHLKHNKHEVLLFHVTDSRTEGEFDFEDRPYEFIDIENGEKIKIQPSEIREFYKENYYKLLHELSEKCAQYRIDFIPADINKGFDQVLSSYLIKRSRMK